MAWKRDPVPWATEKPSPKQKIKALAIGAVLAVLIASLTLVVGGLVAALLASFMR